MGYHQLGITSFTELLLNMTIGKSKRVSSLFQPNILTCIFQARQSLSSDRCLPAWAVLQEIVTQSWNALLGQGSLELYESATF